MQALKPFLDTQNRRIVRGQDVPDDYDRQTLAHYERLGMIGPREPEKAVKVPKPAKPTETKQAKDA